MTSIAALLGVLAMAPSANAAPWGYNGIGVGNEADNCPGSSDTCSVTMTTKVKGSLGSAAYANAPLNVTLTVVISEPITEGYGYCYPASGVGSLAGLPGGTVNLSTVGMLCDMNSTTTHGYYGTYFVTGGAKKNLNASGTGNVAASIEPSNRLFVTIFGMIQR